MTAPKVTPEYRAELRKLADAATPGPWMVTNHYHVSNAEGYRVIKTFYYYRHDEQVCNTAFIAASRSAIPSLLDYIEQLEAMVPHTPEICAHYQPSLGIQCCSANKECYTRYGVCANGKWQLKEVK